MVGGHAHPEDRAALWTRVKHSSTAGGDGDRLIDAVVALFAVTTTIAAIVVTLAIAAITLIVVVITIVTAVMFAIRATKSDLQDDGCRVAGRHGLGLRSQRKGDQGSTDKGQYLFHNVVYKVPDLNLS